jgi:hypothetical protein
MIDRPSRYFPNELILDIAACQQLCGAALVGSFSQDRRKPAKLLRNEPFARTY